ncbi:hypothetical protein G6F65_015050 [Rhizopus arrhizus]|nr:hypothetical protein G6F65_015050 [Rhizopus arrhizus]
MQPVTHQRRQAGNGHQHHQRVRGAEPGDAVQCQRQHHHRKGQHDVAAQVEAGAMAGVVVGHDLHRGDETDHADRQVDQEHPVPGCDLDQPAAQGRADQRADQGGDGDEAHRAQEILARYRTHHRPATDRQQHRAANALQHARTDQLVQVLGQRAGQRTESEQDDRHQEGAPRAVAVGDPAGGRDEGGYRQRVAEHHRLHLQRALAQAGRHRRQGRVDDGRIQHLHEDRQRHQPQQGAVAGVVR